MKKDRQTIAFAFKKSLPVMVGYLFLGSAFGIMLFQAGYNFIWAFFISIFVYAGSMQFMLVSFLSAGTAIPTAAAVTLFVNSRHMFYGLSFIEKFKSMGKRFFYMIHSLTDETYTVFCGMKCPKNTDEKIVYFYVALFNHCYWILGGIIGSLMGQYNPFDFKGVDFSMTALFTVMLVEQWIQFKTHIPAIVGALSAALFLLSLGPDAFLLPSLMTTVLVMLAFRKPLEETTRKGAKQ